jgi:hypothetical protein
MLAPTWNKNPYTGNTNSYGACLRKWCFRVLSS